MTVPSDQFTALSQGDFGVAVSRVAPRGRAWPRLPTTKQAGLWQGLGDAVWDVHATAVRLLRTEADPAQSIELLPEWEYDYGLPDPCTAPNPTLQQRRASLLGGIASDGGQSRDYFIRVAAALGYTATIKEYRPFRFGISHFGDDLCGPGWQFVWQVNVTGLPIHQFRFGSSVFGDAFWTVDSGELECRLKELRPAHTILLFRYA